MKPVLFSDVRRYYADHQPEGHWFDRGTMDFFKTKLPLNAYELSTGGIYFVTRETNPSGEKRFTVRRQGVSGEIVTVGDFHAYKTAAAAKAAIKQIEVLGAVA